MSLLGSLRRLVLAPSLADVSFAGRGFPVVGSDRVRQLEAIPQTVVCGFEWAIEVPDQSELESRLNLIEQEMRGFAYEGATMAYTVLDAMSLGRGRRTRRLLWGPGRPHLFLAYIGIGFAMSHLPRPLWKNVVPDLDGLAYHPTMSWLAVDGYGFDQAYFHTRRWVDEQRRPAPYPWLGAPQYFLRAFDQGVGRALWFIHGGQVQEVAAAVRRFATERQADLWSGVGLAATFAGGCPTGDLAVLRRIAAEDDPDHETHLALGSVFAAKARTFSNFVPAHCEAALQAFTDLSVDAATALADDAAPEENTDATEPRYEQWRRAIRSHVLSRSANVSS